MPANYTLIEKITVGAAGASSVTFSGIPQTGYTDLVVKVSCQGSIANSTFIMQFNGSATGYTSKYLRGSGTAANSYSQVDFGTNGITGTYMAASSSIFDNGEFYVPNYTSANYKSASSDAVDERNTTTAYAMLAAGLWSNTAAITSLSILADTGSFLQYSTFYLYGVAKLGTTPAIVPYATGGDTIMTDGTYWYHAFKSSGTFTPAKGLSCDVLVVAGGGGGGGKEHGAGGGAGGYRTGTALSIAAATTVTVGAGGAGGPSASLGSSGSNSVFSSITSAGGGGGGTIGIAPLSGGSGGGSSYLQVAGAGNTPSTSPSQGFAGGTGALAGPNYGSGGGGGAGAVGADGTGSTGGNGGAGLNTLSSWFSVTGTGVSGYVAGGGGGSSYNGGTPGSGGAGGGGAGSTSTTAGAGVANTGSGGGGAERTGSQIGGAGGSGLVIVRYLV